MEFLPSQGVYSKHFTLRPLWRPTTVPQVSDFTWFDHMYRVSAHALLPPPPDFSAPLPPLPTHAPHGQADHGDEQPLLPLACLPSPAPSPRASHAGEPPPQPHPTRASLAPTSLLCSQDGVARLGPSLVVWLAFSSLLCAAALAARWWWSVVGGRGGGGGDGGDGGGGDEL